MKDYVSIASRYAIFAAIAFLFSFPTLVHADTAVDQLNSQIKQKQAQTKELDSLIKGYRDKIDSKKAEADTLQNQIELLQNQVEEKQLSIQRTQTQIESLSLEIQLMTEQISLKEQSINTQKMLVDQLIRDIEQSDQTTSIDVLLAKPSLSEYFASMEQVKTIERDLGQAVGDLQSAKTELIAQRKDKEGMQTDLEGQRKELRTEMLALEADVNSKASLVQQTNQSEKEFQRIVYELQQQQQSTSDDISSLQTRLKSQLQSIDDILAKGDDMFSWPVDPSGGITAIFHDPGYPFKNLFQHPGIDIRESVGTQVHAAAGGYVAWNKVSKSYGNYTMVIHPGGFATLYAHLSKFVAKPDTFVQRGDVIGLSGGAPGMQGAGLSTGAHVHFEVRLNGIPTDPSPYLPQIPNSYYDGYSDYVKWGLMVYQEGLRERV